MQPRPSPKNLAKTWLEEIQQGNIRTVARVCSLIENEDPLSEKILALLYPFSGQSIVVGITGPPGVGKSTLLSRLVEEALAHQYQVGVIAIDPSSPISGGAILADRLRMSSANQEKVFIRSVATRGSAGGLAYASFGILRVLETMGKKIVFIETVGSGQNEIMVTNLATTTIFVTVPNLGDEIQALKAGILEVSDIFVVNKSDLGNSEITVSQLRSSLTLKDLSERFSMTSDGELLHPANNHEWKFPILSASAIHKKGIAQIFASILEHQEFLRSGGELELRKKKQIMSELFFILEKKLMQDLKTKLTDKLIHSLLKKKLTPHALAKQIISRKLMK